MFCLAKPELWACPWNYGTRSVPNNPHGPRDSERRIKGLFQKKEEWILDELNQQVSAMKRIREKRKGNSQKRSMEM